MSSANNSKVVYVFDIPETASSITYIDPKNPPGRQALLLRGLWETAWSLLFSIVLIPAFCISNSILEFAKLPHVNVIVAGVLGALVTWLVFLPLFLLQAKDTRKRFVKFGGDATGINLLMFCGMLPTGKGHWQSYKLLPPDKREHLKAKSRAKPVTGPFF